MRSKLYYVHYVIFFSAFCYYSWCLENTFIDYVSMTYLSLCQRRSIYNKFFQSLFEEVLISPSFLKAFAVSRIMGFFLSRFETYTISAFEKSTVTKSPFPLQVRDHFSYVTFKNVSLFLLFRSFWYRLVCILSSLPYVDFADHFNVQAGVF